MKKAITLSIPEPCHEDWAKMTPTEKGKFCSVCTKEVFDFTQKTDEEIVKTFENNENLCGRFKKTQLDREIKLERKSGWNVAPWAASLLLPLSLLASPKTTSENPKPKTYKSIGIGSHTAAANIFNGVIGDANGNLLVGVKITVIETGATTISNEKGQFVIAAKGGDTLWLQKEGYLDLKVEVNGAKGNKLVMALENEIIEEILLGDVIEEFDESLITGKIAPPQNKTVKGTVVDEEGLPLPGVNVIIKGTNKGTQTDFDGNFEVEARNEEMLEFSYVGYETKKIEIAE